MVSRMACGARRGTPGDRPGGRAEDRPDGFGGKRFASRDVIGRGDDGEVEGDSGEAVSNRSLPSMI